MARTRDENALSFNTVCPRDAAALLRHTMAVGRPVMLWGPPGIGKSDIIAQIGKSQNRPVIDLRLLLMEPTDLKGIPYYDTKTGLMRWAKPSELPTIVSAEDVTLAENTLARLVDDKAPEEDIKAARHHLEVVAGNFALQNAILFLDEVNAAPQSVQAAAYQLILNRKIGEYILPKGVSIVAAGNRETDKAVTFRMPSALANRFVHLEMKVRFDDWFDWSIDHRVKSDVVGFLKAHPHRLFEFDPKNASKAFPTPRSWVFVSELMSDDMPDNLNQFLVAGTVGDGLALEFMQHRRLKDSLPSVEDILSGRVTKFANPDKVEISALYSLVISLCHSLQDFAVDNKSDSKAWETATTNFLEFTMNNLSNEVAVLAAVTAIRKYKIDFVFGSKAFDKFYEKYGESVNAYN